MLENPYYLSDPPYEDPSQEIDELCRNGHAIKGFGKRQHGMNGKDADLDHGGQCVVKRLEVLDPTGAESMIVRIHILQHANVCSPDGFDELEGETDEQYEARLEAANDAATEIVSSETRYEGEWTGSDYWSFRNEETIDVSLSVDEYESIADGSQAAIDGMCSKLSEAIYAAVEKLGPFENAMTELNQAIDAINP